MRHLYLFISMFGAYLSTIFCQILRQSRSSQPGIDNFWMKPSTYLTYPYLLLLRELKPTAKLYFNNIRLFYTCVAISGWKRALDFNFVLRNYHVRRLLNLATPVAASSYLFLFSASSPDCLVDLIVRSSSLRLLANCVRSRWNYFMMQADE